MVNGYVCNRNETIHIDPIHVSFLIQQYGVNIQWGKGLSAGDLSLSEMEAISLESMEEVRLMNRLDTKYMLSVSRLPEVLQRVRDHYDVLDIGGRRMATYETVYYDWPSGRFFLDHVNGKLSRNKVRIRQYVESRIQFLEIKRKINTGRTKKIRMRQEEQGTEWSEENLAFLSQYIEGDIRQLHPLMVNRFKRITLVNRGRSERVTIDVGLSYADLSGTREEFLPGLAIVEIKQDRFSGSVMKSVLKEMRIKRCGISKYCLGITLLGLSEKINNYKRKIRTLQKITQNGIIA